MGGKENSWDWIKIINSALLIFILGAILGGGGFAYKEWYNIPKLTYESLTSYPLSEDEFIIPIIIRNEGREKATNVRITIEAAGEILDVQKKTPEALQQNLEDNLLVATLDRLVERSQISFYLRIKTGSQTPVNEIFITSDQGPGKLHIPGGESVSFQIIIAVLLGITLSYMFDIYRRVLKYQFLK